MAAMESLPAGFVVVHLGAGYHSRSKIPKYKSLCRKTCNLGIQLCHAGHKASHIACEVVSLLEDSDLTNAGFGSNLTNDGKVQCDASLMGSQHGNFAAVGCVEGIKNPIRVAYDLLENQEKDDHDCGLEPPMILVGNGATKWALERSISEVSNAEMVSDKSLATHRKAKRALENLQAETATRHHLKRKPQVSRTFSETENQAERLQGALLTPCNAKKKSMNFVTERMGRNAANCKETKCKLRSHEGDDLHFPHKCLRECVPAPGNAKRRRKTLMTEHTDHRKWNVDPVKSKRKITNCPKDNLRKSYELLHGEDLKLDRDIQLRRTGNVSRDSGMGSSFCGREKSKRKAKGEGRGGGTIGKSRTGLHSTDLMQDGTVKEENDFPDKGPAEGNGIFVTGCSADDYLSDHEDRLDTVGAICVDKHGNVCSAVSSGGLILKHSGRIGQAACFGCGCFVTETDSSSEHKISACSTSGCGEQLIKTVLAKQCAEEFLESGNDIDFNDRELQLLENSFLKSRYLRNTDERLAGCINVKVVWHNGNSEEIDSHNDIGDSNQTDTVIATDSAGVNIMAEEDTVNTEEGM